MAAQMLSQELPWHVVCESAVQTRSHYDRRGKPAATDVPSQVRYVLSATLQPDEGKVATYRQRAGRFILATNVLEVDALSTEDALSEYKAQQGTERGFRFLKDPLFFASSVFLKTPKRIAVVGMIRALCLLVYNLGQRQLRNAVVASAVVTIFFMRLTPYYFSPGRTAECGK